MNRINNYERKYRGENLKMPNKASRIDALWRAILNKEPLPFKPITRAEKELAKKLNSQRTISEPVTPIKSENITEIK